MPFGHPRPPKLRTEKAKSKTLLTGVNAHLRGFEQHLDSTNAIKINHMCIVIFVVQRKTKQTSLLNIICYVVKVCAIKFPAKTSENSPRIYICTLISFQNSVDVSKIKQYTTSDTKIHDLRIHLKHSTPSYTHHFLHLHFTQISLLLIC